MTLTEAQFRNDIVKNGIAQVGRNYRDSADPTNWPSSSFDCSTFTHWLLAKYGVNIDAGRLDSISWPPAKPSPWHKYPGYTMTQQKIAKDHNAVISFASIKPGDILYYDKPGQHHVVVYIGGGKVVHASSPRTGVIISPVGRPGEVVYGGKKLSLCVSSTKLARSVGYKFASAPAPSTKPIPVKRPTVFLSHILSAIKKDGPAAQGHTTYKSEVLLVERALAKEGLLTSSLVDGSAGTSSFGNHSAYQAWQKRMHFTGNDANGIPGIQSLASLGHKYGFNVV